MQKKIAWALWGLLLSCGGEDFDPQTKIDGVRILSSKADKPYAKPGEKVNLELLVADGRKDKTRPMKVYWIPIPCVNPREDLYYLCFSGSGGGATGTASGSLGSLPVGQDVSASLPQGTKYSVDIPKDVIVPRPQANEPYGLVILFNVACAGRVAIKAPDPKAGPQGVPIECVDEFGAALPPSDYVIGLTRIYSYAKRQNKNPVIQGLSFDGSPVDPKVGITVERCDKKKETDCKEHKIDVAVPAESQELNEGEVGADGNTPKELVWAAYYSTDGRFESDARLLYDTASGKIQDTSLKFYAAKEALVGKVWVVVKDNRGGSAWLDVPLTVK